jgi:GntR family transcriptional regulator
MAAAPVIRIDLSQPEPAYRQITDAIRPLLVAGDLAPGDQLPTVRDLAVDLGVHHNTVAEAYRSLAAEGWLDLTRRRGATVLDRSAPAPTVENQERFLRRLRSLVAEARAAGVPLDSFLAEMRRLARGTPARSEESR